MRGIVIAVAVLVASLPAAARAQLSSASLTLVWETSEASCASGAEVLAETERILGSSSAPRKNVAARAKVRRDASGSFRIALVTTTDALTAERSFAANTCAEAASAVALIVALAVDANARLDAGSAPPTEEPPAPVVPPPPPVPPARPVRAPVRPSLLGFVGVELAAGAQPGPALGGGLGVAIDLGGSRLEVAGAYLPRSEALTGEPGKGAAFHGLALALRACEKRAVLWFEVGGCLSGGLRRVSGAAFGTARSEDGASTWGDVGLGVVALGPLTKAFAIRLFVGAEAPFQRARFVVSRTTGEADTLVYRVAPMTGSGLLGVEAHFFLTERRAGRHCPGAG